MAQFTDTDRLISFLIAGGFALWLALTAARMPGWPEAQIPTLLVLAVGGLLALMAGLVLLGLILLKAEDSVPEFV